MSVKIDDALPVVKHNGLKTAGVSYSKVDTASTAGGVQVVGFTSTATTGLYVGTGSPTVAAGKGSLYIKTDATTTNTRLYINTDGDTTWTAFTAAA